VQTTYTIKVGPNVPSFEGKLLSESSKKSQFTTTPAFEYNGIAEKAPNNLNIIRSGKQYKDSIWVSFNQPLLENFQQSDNILEMLDWIPGIKITPEIEGEWGIEANSYYYNLLYHTNLNRNTEYTVTIPKGACGISKDRLTKKRSKSFQTVNNSVISVQGLDLPKDHFVIRFSQIIIKRAYLKSSNIVIPQA